MQLLLARVGFYENMFVRFSDSVPTVAEGAIETPIQSCGGTVGGATADGIDCRRIIEKVQPVVTRGGAVVHSGSEKEK